MIRNSKRYKFRPFKASDLNWVELLDDEREAIHSNVATLQALADKTGLRKTCGIAIYDDKPLFIGCYCEISPGVAEVIIIPDRRIYEHSRIFVRNVIEWRRWLESRHWCRRIQTLSLPTSLIDRWMEALGFICEDKLSGYTEAGQAYRLWSREKVDGIWGHSQKPERAN